MNRDGDVARDHCTSYLVWEGPFCTTYVDHLCLEEKSEDESASDKQRIFWHHSWKMSMLDIGQPFVLPSGLIGTLK